MLSKIAIILSLLFTVGTFADVNCPTLKELKEERIAAKGHLSKERRDYLNNHCKPVYKKAIKAKLNNKK